ncbi:hypothetical protein V8D89_006966 [Ganoderma adspersum]
MLLLSTIMQAAFLLLALAVSALGKPLAFRPRDAISPPITNPTASSVWKAGDRQTVTWDLSGLNGAQPSNPLGKVILGTFINGEEHLMLESPLASGFNILDGNVTLTVPTVTTGNDYIVCRAYTTTIILPITFLLADPAPESQKLTHPSAPSAPAVFGSSGDISAPFTIVGTDASASASTHINAASSSNTLPPHETTDPSTTVSLPHGVPVTGDPSSAPTTTASDASSTTALVSIPSGVVPPSGTPAASSTATAPGASSTGTAASLTDTGSGTGTGTATAAASTGNSGARMAAVNVPLWSAAVSGALALFALL